VASEAERSLKAALYSVNNQGRALLADPAELRRDVRRAATDHHALLEFLRSGVWERPPLREDDTDEAYVSNLVGVIASELVNSRTRERLHFEDLDSSQEPIFLDRYTAWLKQPPHGSESKSDQAILSFSEAEGVCWQIQEMAAFYGKEFEPPLK
jgi:hypothetical protein